jgi:hypothetical protein
MHKLPTCDLTLKYHNSRSQLTNCFSKGGGLININCRKLGNCSNNKVFGIEYISFKIKNNFIFQQASYQRIGSVSSLGFVSDENFENVGV